MIKDNLNCISSKNMKKYLYLENKLNLYNKEHSTNYEIVHNGLELCVFFDENHSMSEDVMKLIAESGFEVPNLYGYGTVCHLLWVDKSSNRNLILNKLLE